MNIILLLNTNTLTDPFKIDVTSELVKQCVLTYFIIFYKLKKLFFFNLRFYLSINYTFSIFYKL